MTIKDRPFASSRPNWVWEDGRLLHWGVLKTPRRIEVGDKDKFNALASWEEIYEWVLASSNNRMPWRRWDRSLGLKKVTRTHLSSMGEGCRKGLGVIVDVLVCEEGLRVGSGLAESKWEGLADGEGRGDNGETAETGYK